MSATAEFGTNSWLVEEMYEKYRADPDSVGDAWREFFADYKSAAPAPAPAVPVARAAEPAPAPTATAPAPAPAAAPAVPKEAEPEPGDPIRGVGAVIATNMAKSLAV